MKNFNWTLLTLLALSWSCVHSRSVDTTEPKKNSPEQSLTSLPEIVHEKQIEIPAEKVVEAIIVENIVAATIEQAIETEVKKEVEDDIQAARFDFEGGSGDNDNSLSGVRDKRSFGLLGANLGGSRTQGRSGPSRQSAYNRQLRNWIAYQKRQIAKFNETEGGNYTTPFPMLPPPPPEEEDEPTTQRPGGFLGNIIQAQLHFIPNLFRATQSFFQEVGPQLQNFRLGAGGGGGGGGLLRGLLVGNRGGSSSSSIGGGSSSYGGTSSYSSPSDLMSPFSSESSSSSSGNADAESSTYKITLG